MPCRISPLMHSGDSCAGIARERKAAVGIVFLKASAKLKSAGRNLAQPAPLPVTTSNTSMMFPARAGSLPAAWRARTGSRLRGGLLPVALTVIRIPSRISSGSKPVTTIGTLYARGDREIFFVPHDGADVARGQKSLHHAVVDESSASIAGGTSTCETSSEKFSMPS
jgi:hypothetical protein